MAGKTVLVDVDSPYTFDEMCSRSKATFHRICCERVAAGWELLTVQCPRGGGLILFWRRSRRQK